MRSSSSSTNPIKIREGISFKHGTGLIVNGRLRQLIDDLVLEVHPEILTKQW